MANDGEVLRLHWDSKVPVSFNLSPNDQYSIKNPEPYFLLVPRMSYFPLLFDKLIVYFSQFIDANTKSTSNMWLDFLGTPLRLNYPIGVLFDLYHSDIDLPWTLTVNFDRFPAETLVKCNTRASMESTYMSCLKEADTLKHRNPIVATMHKKDHNQLWTGLLQHKYDQFWSINRRLMVPDNVEPFQSHSHQDGGNSDKDGDKISVEGGDKTTSANGDYFRHIPFRLYVVNSQGSDASPVCHQRLIKPVCDGRPAAFKDLLVQTLGKESALERYRFVTQGIEPVMSTPLQWMSEHMSFLDNFLHIIAFHK